MDMLAERPEVIEMELVLPDMGPVREWIKIETKLGNPAFRAYCKSHPHPALEPVLEWTEALNADIAKWLRSVPPFHYGRKIN